AIGGYERAAIGVGSSEIRAVLEGAVAAVAMAGLTAALLPGRWLTLAIVALPVAVMGSLLARLVVRRSLHRRQASGHDLRPMVLVGAPDAVATLGAKLLKTPHLGVLPVAACVPLGSDPTSVVSAGVPVVGDLTQVPAAVREFAAEGVAVTGGTPDGFLRSLAWSLEGSNADLLVDAGLMEVAGPRL